MKRILPFILAITMMLGAFTPGLAWSGPIMEVWESIGSDATGTFYPGQTITFDLYPSMFDWDTGWEDRPRNVTRQHLRDSDITIRTVGLERSVMSTAIGERNGRAYVTVRFEENFGNLAGTRINTSIYLAIGGERQDRSRVDVRGTLSSGPPLTTSQSSAQPGGLVLPPPGSQFGAAVVPPVEQRPAVTEESARTRTAEAVQSARAAGASFASVRFLDSPSVSGAALRAANGAAGNMQVNFNGDTMSGNSVLGRITINPANAANISGSINLGVFVDSARTSVARSVFERWYTNRFAVVSLAQKSDFGMTVRVAAFVDLAGSGLDTANLILYAYDAQTNMFTRLTDASPFVDSVGYLQFSTASGGEIIITDRVLARR